MNFEFKLAWKYFRGRRKSLARFTTIVAVVGIACGVASLIVAQSITRGFSNEIREKILSSTAHIAVFQADGSGIHNWLIVKKELEKIDNITEISPTTYENAVIITEKTSSYAVVRAIEKAKLEAQNLTREEVQTKNQNSNPDELIIDISIGSELAEKTNLKIGDEAKVILSSAIDKYAARTCYIRVRDVFRTGLYDYDSTWIYISFEDLARVFERNDFSPTVLNISVRDIYAADKTAQSIREVLPPEYKVIDWQQANQPLFASMSLEKKVSFVIISLIIFIAALNITTTLALLVGERRLDIAVLRTCGAQAKSLILIFLIEGAFLGLTGIFFGLILGLAACFAGNYFKLIHLPAEIYSVSYVHLYPNLIDISVIVLIAFSLCLAATIYPAWRAANIKPLINTK